MTKKKQYCPKSKKLMWELGDLNGAKFAQKNHPLRIVLRGGWLTIFLQINYFASYTRRTDAP